MSKIYHNNDKKYVFVAVTLSVVGMTMATMAIDSLMVEFIPDVVFGQVLSHWQQSLGVAAGWAMLLTTLSKFKFKFMSA